MSHRDATTFRTLSARYLLYPKNRTSMSVLYLSKLLRTKSHLLENKVNMYSQILANNFEMSAAALHIQPI